jgi:adenylate cyclase class IV
MPSSPTHKADDPGPVREIELKAVVADPVAVMRRLTSAGAILVFQGMMHDRRYDRNGELTLRDEILRTRRLVGEDGSQVSVLGWKGVTRVSPEGYKLRDEREYKIEGGASPDVLLRILGYSVTYMIDREIEMYHLDEAIIRVEHYPLMDVLIEIEGTPVAIENAVRVTGIPRSEFTPEAFSEFVTRYEARTGTRARVALDDFE